MSLSSALSNAVSGMNAASKRAEITSHNIANATTEGYARQTVSTVQNVTAGQGSGVRTEVPTRVTDPRLTASRREADSESAASDTQATSSRALADAYSGSKGLFEQIAALETGLRGVSETPESTALQERAVASAGRVVDAFGSMADTIQTQRTDADGDISGAVSDVNTALKQIETLNQQISQSRINGVNSAAFEQQRDDQIDIVSENLSIRLMSRDYGQVAVLTDKGVTLLDGKASELEFSPINVVTADMDYRAGGSPLSGLSVDGIDISPQSGSQSNEGGRIAGLFEVRDGIGVQAIAEIDAAATDLIARFEGAGLAAADGRGLFTDAGAASSASAAPGLAGRITLNERVDPAQGGAVWRVRDGLDAATQGPTSSGAFAQSLLDAMTAERTSGGSVAGATSAAGLAGEIGSLFEQRSQLQEDIASTNFTFLSALQSEETSVIGVDMDQELQSLILVEQAYGANAKVIQIADRLVQRLLEI